MTRSLISSLVCVSLAGVSLLFAVVGCLQRFVRAEARENIVWAWKRPEDLSWIDPERTKVAVLLASFVVHKQSFSTELRREPLIAPDNSVNTAVFRIDRVVSKSPEPAVLENLASEIVRLATQASVSSIQIDFDAPVSQRRWYAVLLARLRALIGSSLKLEMTALASWCRERPSWLETLPVDDVVPMYFRMGPEGGAIKAAYMRGDTLSPVCRHTIGISLDESLTPSEDVKRMYFFNPTGWSKLNEKSLDIFQFARE